MSIGLEDPRPRDEGGLAALILAVLRVQERRPDTHDLTEAPRSLIKGIIQGRLWCYAISLYHLYPMAPFTPPKMGVNNLFSLRTRTWRAE